MRPLARLFFWGYVAMLWLAGGIGVLFPSWELSTIFRVDLATLTDEAQSTLLNQYRFLKAIEVGFGLFCVTFAREIFTVRRLNRLFLAILLLGAGARLLSMVVDGGPHWIFVAFTVLELIAGALVFAVTRRELRQ